MVEHWREALPRINPNPFAGRADVIITPINQTPKYHPENDELP